MTVMTQDPTVGLMSRKYDLVALNPALSQHLPDLDEALNLGCLMPDRKRTGFFDILHGGQWFYVYIRQNTSVVYLVAHRNTSGRVLTEESDGKLGTA